MGVRHMGAFDEIIQKYGHSQGNIPVAQARLSHVPISFVAPSTITSVTSRDPGLYNPPSGLYDQKSKSIKIDPTPTSTFRQIQSVVRHEDVHAMLDSIGRAATQLPPALWNIPKTLSEPALSLLPAWFRSGMAGNF